MPLKRCRQSTVASAPKRTRHAYGRPNLGQPVGRTEAEYPPPAKLKASFLALPRELRDQIYHEIWRTKPPFEVALPAKGDPHSAAQVYGMCNDYHVFKIFYELLEAPSPMTIIPTKNKKSSARLSRTKIKPKRPVPWFIVSRQILHESMEQFNRQAAWGYITCSYGRKERQLAVWKPLYAKRYSGRISPKLLALGNAATLNMPNLLTMYVHGEMDANENPLNSVIFDRNAAELLRALGCGLAGTTSLKHLSIVLWANAWRGGASDHPIVVNLRLLSLLDLPNLQLLRLSSIGEMGMAMVGGERRMEFEAGELPTDEWRIVFTKR
ncbi:hypothetical protein BKA66DRAFT_28714 [Pyrenochaeta sp. MPI-SDFR-AT-0127]|nr:hypothetical protein BKA66DRAFT_28714 [Pyrenochaeta sp. MPI-SDFR-AT-0127]